MSDIELAVLKRSVQDVSFLTRAVNQLNGYSYATPELNWIWTLAKKCCVEHAEAPGFKLVLERAKTEFDDDDALLAMIRAIREVKAADLAEASPLSSLAEMKNRLQLQHGASVAERMVQAIEDQDADALTEAMREGEQKVAGKGAREGDSGVLEVAKLLIAPRKSEALSNFVPSGFSFIDRRWRGFKVGELVLIAGVTNVGKSITATNIGAKSVSRAIPTLHVGTEMDKEGNGSRYISRFTGIPEEDIREQKLNKTERRLLARWTEANWDRMNRLLRLERISPNAGTVADLRALVRERKVAGVPPRLLVVDSPDHLKSNRRYNDRRHESTDIYYDLKGLAEEERIVVVVTTQVAKEWAGKVATKESVADNYEKSRIADWFISINALKGDSGEELLFMYLGKRRSGKRNILVPLVCELERMRMDSASEEFDA